MWCHNAILRTQKRIVGRGRFARKCDVYCVIAIPVALRVSRRMKTARCSLLGMVFSSPTEQIRSSGALPERSALPSLVTVTTAPVSATAKLAPVIPAVAIWHEPEPVAGRGPDLKAYPPVNMAAHFFSLAMRVAESEKRRRRDEVRCLRALDPQILQCFEIVHHVCHGCP